MRRHLSIFGIVMAVTALFAVAVWALAPRSTPPSASFTQAVLSQGAASPPDRRLQAEAIDVAQTANQISNRQALIAAIAAATGLATLLAAVLAALFARRAAVEARRSADIAHTALIAGERAWINVDLELTDPLVFERSGGVSAGVAVKITNIGKTLALNVHTHVDLTLDHRNAPERVSRLAAEQRLENTTYSRNLLPSQSYLRPWYPTSHPSEFEEYSLGGTVLPVVIGCVTYQIWPDLSLHQTSFCFMLSADDIPGEPSGMFGPDHLVPVQNTKVEMTTGGFAD